MIKRLFLSHGLGFGLVLASPAFSYHVFDVVSRQASTVFIAPRVGYYDIPLMMIMLLSMVINADKFGVDSTGANDNRITSVAHFLSLQT
jgi:lipopolysaccharide/colanic/teichoic acid biosynthesis glycosyltransferase